MLSNAFNSSEPSLMCGGVLRALLVNEVKRVDRVGAAVWKKLEVATCGPCACAGLSIGRISCCRCEKRHLCVRKVDGAAVESRITRGSKFAILVRTAHPSKDLRRLEICDLLVGISEAATVIG